MHRLLGVCAYIYVYCVGVCNCYIPVLNKTLWLSRVFIGCDCSSQAETYLTSCLAALVISAHAVGNLGKGRECCFPVLLSMQGAVCLISSVQHLNFTSKITTFYVTKDVATRETLDHCGKILQNVFLLAAHSHKPSRL